VERWLAISYTNWFFGRNSSSIEAKKVYCGYLNERNSGWDTSSCSDLNDYLCKITKGKLEFYILKYFVPIFIFNRNQPPISE
jgi:hypothetical protein